jgi:arginase
MSSDTHLRLIWPQWQGVGTISVQELAAEFPFDIGRRGYAVGSAVLAASCRRTTAPPPPPR